MSGKSYIYSIKGLLIPKHEDESKIIKSVEEYIEFIPELTELLKTNLTKQKSGYFIDNLKMALFLLKNVYARWLATDAEALIKSAERGHLDVCRKSIGPFITDLLSLSIEMQMAQKSSLQEIVSHQSKVEVYTDIVNNVTAVGKLTVEAEYSRAGEMLAAISDLEDNGIARRLAMALERSDGEESVRLVKELREHYISCIVHLGGSKNGLEQKILAVDDRPEILASAGRILKEQYKVLCASSGPAAIKIFIEQKPDLFLLDIDMPIMDGFALAETIRGFDEFAKTPIIFLTSNASSNYVIRALQSGGNDFIVKPASREILLAKAAKYLL